MAYSEGSRKRSSLRIAAISTTLNIDKQTNKQRSGIIMAYSEGSRNRSSV